MDPKFLRDKRFWAATFLITWAAALQAHMTWMQRQVSFRETFGDVKEKASVVTKKTDDLSEDNLGEFNDNQAISEYQGNDAERLE